jgi:hypothetical protein
MAKWVPFTLHVRIVPARGSGALKTKRFETVRDAQKTATLMFDALENEVNINIAEPGGGQHQSFLGSGRGGMGGLTRGFAVKPQMGQVPAQTMITGFWNDGSPNDQPHPEHQRISGGETFTGPAPAHPWEANPVSQTDAMCTNLKNTVEAAFAIALPGGVEFKIFRIDISGVVYGDKGHHFP